ncbi:hypothetical protein SIID45300_02395 [Candidatus Magnetaquicoccaceae bacterium FCR-1]|uniref:Bacteriophage Mu GpT domain-containing protein n=1 Tax=Candidatus Magnetaquiglobus chichijimensis TaxID=3141448 RepID=A0ABQ0CBI4_9PROT
MAEEENPTETQPGATGVLLEAKDGTRFLVRVIRAGLSGNGVFYPDAVLREAAPLFDKARVLIKGDQEHLKGGGKDPRNIVGRLTETVFVEGRAPDTGELRATLEVLQSAGDMSARLTEAVSRGMADLYGLSMFADGRTVQGAVSGKPARLARAITKVHSVDLIVEPGAGGEIVSLIEAQNTTPHHGQSRMKKFLIEQIQARKPELLAGKDPEALRDDEVEAIFKEAYPDPEPEPTTSQTTTPATTSQPTTPATTDDLDLRIQQAVEAKTQLREALDTSGLPPAARDRVAQRLGSRFVPDLVDREIRAERDYLSQVTASGRVTGLGGSRARLVESQRQKTDKMLDVLLGSAAAGPGDTLSLRAAYGRMTGDFEVSGRMRSANMSIMAEALDSDSWSEVLGDAMTRRLLADYRAPAAQDIWRNLANTVPVRDFRDQKRTRIGGYGDLPKVAQGGAYQPLSSPDDENADYAAEKRGGTESVTLEMIMNDDVGALRQIPIKLARAAKRTLGKFVLDLLRTNPTVYDGKALFHADHANLGSAVLDATSWMAARLAMLAQTESGSNEPLGIAPKYLWVPTTLEEAAKDLFVRNTNLDPTFLQTTAPTVVSVWYWTDPNNWFVSADKLDIPSIEIGFLGGNEEPEIFIQDNPTVGSLFTNDQVTYKIRHIYGGTVTDHRGLYGAIVA